MEDKKKNITIKTYQDIINSCNSTGWQKLLKEIDILLYTTVKQDDDMLILIDGEEGAGKSKLMRILGKYCQLRLKDWGFEVPFDVNNIHFDLDEYIKTSNEAQDNGIKGFPNILDESRMVANRKRSNSKSSVLFTNFLSECRSANQPHFIALPAFHDIDSNIVLWRSKFIIHITKIFIEDDNSPVGYSLERGGFKIFSDWNKIKNAYYNRWRYVYPRKADYTGKFPNIEVIDIDSYNDKKNEYKKKKYENSKENSQPTKKEQIIDMLKAGNNVQEIIKELKCDKAYVYTVKKYIET